MKYQHDRFVKIPLSTMVMIVPGLKDQIERLQKWGKETKDPFNRHSIEFLTDAYQLVINEVEAMRTREAKNGGDEE